MRIKSYIFSTAIIFSSFLAINLSHAQDGAELFKTKGCLACHGIDAKTPINDNIPKLAGQSKGYLVQQITDIGSGARANGQTAQMKAIAAGLSEAEIEAVAEYLSTL